ncbi:MAG: hypothetical protein JWQ23_4431 [Herminiimonas sp.]|nr:hypothetical protein [Herminiimonas sp.]
MDVEVIYLQPDGEELILGLRKMSDIPTIGKPFMLDHRRYLPKSYTGPDAEGHYRLFLEDEPGPALH